MFPFPIYPSLGQGPGWKEQGGLTTTQREAPASQPLIGGFWRPRCFPMPSQGATARCFFMRRFQRFPSSSLLCIYWSILRTMPVVGLGERSQLEINNLT